MKRKFTYKHQIDDKSFLVIDHDLFSISSLFHENTKIRRHYLPKFDISYKQVMSRSFKTYSTAPKIQLTKDLSCFSAPPFIEVVLRRRTNRNYSNQPLNLNHLSCLLYLSYGITCQDAKENYVDRYRASPSAGATFPLEVYPFVFNVETLEQGIYHYNVRDNVLEFLREGDFRARLSDIALNQDFVAKSAATFVLTAVFDRLTFRYGERGYRYALLDAGHLVQNTYLVATALGLGACSIGGFFDDELNALVEADGVNESAIYAISVGKI